MQTTYRKIRWWKYTWLLGESGGNCDNDKSGVYKTILTRMQLCVPFFVVSCLELYKCCWSLLDNKLTDSEALNLACWLCVCLDELADFVLENPCADLLAGGCTFFEASALDWSNEWHWLVLAEVGTESLGALWPCEADCIKHFGAFGTTVGTPCGWTPLLGSAWCWVNQNNYYNAKKSDCKVYCTHRSTGESSWFVCSLWLHTWAWRWLNWDLMHMWHSHLVQWLVCGLWYS